MYTGNIAGSKQKLQPTIFSLTVMTETGKLSRDRSAAFIQNNNSRSEISVVDFVTKPLLGFL